uniref:PABPN1 like, cytoplasmic n=1 Tax=Loxodonta africana TaxID=9785 RepID=G3UJR0_LOXAF
PPPRPGSREPPRTLRPRDGGPGVGQGSPLWGQGELDTRPVLAEASVGSRASVLCCQELEAIRLKLWAMEQAGEPPGLPNIQGVVPGEHGGSPTPGNRPGLPFPESPQEKEEVDHRSIYVGNVDYGATAEELEAYFNPCGEIHRVTILCDKFSGHPKGYAYIEFAATTSVQAAVKLDESVFRDRVIKVQPKRTNFPGISSTDRGGLRGHPSARGGAFYRSSLQGGPKFRPRGPNRHRGRGRLSPWFSPY